ncbi:MAG: hypothetical protein ABFC63_01930 [Thermoguttaceae bacterium]
MMTIRAHFDGNVFVPDETVDVPVGKSLELRVECVPATAEELLSPVIVGLAPALSQAIALNPELAAENM